MSTWRKWPDIYRRKQQRDIKRDTRFAEKISGNVSEADSVARKKLHIAAVFACNFTNYLWGFSVDILKSIGQDLSVMEPLVKATFEKAQKVSPHEGQTGPARRNDLITIQKHLDMLNGEAQRHLLTIIA